MQVQVQCRGGVVGSGQPVRFQLNGADYLVEEVLDQWVGTQCSFFKLRADDGQFYVLRHDEICPPEIWDLTFFRKDVGWCRSKNKSASSKNGAARKASGAKRADIPGA